MWKCICRKGTILFKHRYFWKHGILCYCDQSTHLSVVCHWYMTRPNSGFSEALCCVLAFKVHFLPTEVLFLLNSTTVLTHSLPKLPPYRAIDSRYSQLSTRQSLLIPLMVPSQTAQLSLQLRALLYDWVLPPPRQNAQLSFQYVCPTGHPHCFWEQQALHPQRKTSLSVLTGFLAHLFKKPGDEVYVTNQLLNTDFLSHEIPGFFLSTGRRWIPTHKEGGSSHGNSYRNTVQTLIYLLV